jgi:hypothetical protein
MHNNNFFCSEQKGTSQFWKGLHKVKHLFQWGAEYRVFRGDKVRFWQDSWLGNMPLRIQFDSLFQICEDQEALVEEVWNGGDWDLSSRRSLSGTLIGEWQLLRGLLEEVSLDISRGDEVKWVLDKSQVFQSGGYWFSLGHQSSGNLHTTFRIKGPETCRTIN